MKEIEQLRTRYSLAQIEVLCSMPKRTLSNGRPIPKRYLGTLIDLYNKHFKEEAIPSISLIEPTHWIDKYGLIRYKGEDGKDHTYKPIIGDQFFKIE